MRALIPRADNPSFPRHSTVSDGDELMMMIDELCETNLLYFSQSWKLEASSYSALSKHGGVGEKWTMSL